MALSTRFLWCSASPGTPKGYWAERKGGGSGTPAFRMDSGIGNSLARLLVPHGSPKWTASIPGAWRMSHKLRVPLLEVKSKATIGANGCTTSWSTLTTRSPACNAAFEKAPFPAKSSTKTGGDPCETALDASDSQSVCVQR